MRASLLVVSCALAAATCSPKAADPQAGAAPSPDASAASPTPEAPEDWTLDGGGARAVFDLRRTRLADLGPVDGGEDLYYVQPRVTTGLKPLPTRLETFTLGDGTAHVVREVIGRPLRHHVWFSMEGDRAVIESALENRGDTPAIASLGELVAWGNLPSWVAGHGWATYPSTLSGELIAREGMGHAYALCTPGARVQVRFPEHWLPGFDVWPNTSAGILEVPPGATSERRRVVISHGLTLGDAAVRTGCLQGHEVPWPMGGPPGLRAEVSRCDGHGPLVLADPEAPFVVPTPCARVRFTAPGHAPGPWQRLDDGAWPKARWPVGGTLVVDTGGAPARVVVRGRAGAPDPDWGLGAGGRAGPVAYGLGERLELPLAPGRYRVTVDRGFEYTLHGEELDIRADETTTVTARLERAFETPGWISADLHLHAAPSPDAPAALEDRVRSVVAAGVEVAVATDHNAVTDYGPVIARMAQQHRVTSIVGNEITTRGTLFGHFNAFPLDPTSDPTPYTSTTASELFAATRERGPDGTTPLLQVNHPRMRHIGYFELLRLDPRDIAGWQARTLLADLSFEAIEVFNGLYIGDLPKVERNLEDWYALLSAGHRRTATGNSDSHRLGVHEAGSPRNYVRVPADQPERLEHAAFLAGIRAGEVVVSNGPFVTLEAGGTPIGGTVAPGQHEAVVRVDRADWVAVDRVELVKNGRVVVARAPPPNGEPWTVRLDLAAGDWLIAIARGSRAMEPFVLRSLPFAFTNPVLVALR